MSSGGEVVFAEAVERSLQSKRAINCPPDSLNEIEALLDRYCEADTDLVLAKTWADWTFAYDIVRKLLMLPNALSLWASGIRNRLDFSHFAEIGTPNYSTILGDWVLASHVNGYRQASVNLTFRFRLRSFLKTATKNPKSGNTLQRRLFTASFDHHLSHAAAACFSSPFSEAVCAIVDGFGQVESVAFYWYSRGRLKRLRTGGMSLGSLGTFYALVCAACGFDPMKGEEWKVMGLAPYGRFDAGVYGLLSSWLKVDGLRLMWNRSLSQIGREVANAASTYGREDLAFVGQLVFEEHMQKLLANLGMLAVSDNLVLSGGCALNSSMNGLVLEQTPFKNLYVFCAPGDDGNAIGAAQLAYQKDHPGEPSFCGLQSPYLGSTMSTDAVARMRKLGGVKGRSRHPGTIHRRTAELLAQGRIVGWIQGRAEFGPRSLGNRSILADPRDPEIKEKLNERVKFREEFRPYAPSILHEYGSDYFEGYQESPYMERTLRFKESVISKVPGVVHVNKTGRVHSVKREWNEQYYELIREFYEITGIPILLNTSFNRMGKPLIHSVEDAIGFFYTSGLDVLVIGDELVEK